MAWCLPSCSIAPGLEACVPLLFEYGKQNYLGLTLHEAYRLHEVLVLCIGFYLSLVGERREWFTLESDSCSAIVRLY
jgi:hypothetical protein